MLDFEFASRWIKECTKNDKPYGNLAKKTQWHTEWTGGDEGGAAPPPLTGNITSKSILRCKDFDQCSKSCR